MWKRKLCLNTTPSYNIPVGEQVRLFRDTGFEAFFTDSVTDTKESRKAADETGMIYQSIHAPFSRAAQMWTPSDTSRDAVTELTEYLEKCSDVSVDLLIAHVWIGFTPNDGPNGYGIENWDKVIRRAEELGVRIALENTEGEEFLEALLLQFKDRKSVGFCFDSGHELCYNKSKDMLSLYGDRLFGTHFNDNLGVRDYNGNITYIDDLHLLPFDGIADWDNIAKRLNKCSFDGVLTFELFKNNSNGRFNHSKYERMSLEEFIAEAYASACKVAALCEKFNA